MSKSKNAFGTNISTPLKQLIENSCDEQQQELLLGSTLEKSPIWPGCENVEESYIRKCFQEQIQKHIARNFRYPEEAQLKGIQGRVFVLL